MLYVINLTGFISHSAPTYFTVVSELHPLLFLIKLRKDKARLIFHPSILSYQKLSNDEIEALTAQCPNWQDYFAE